MLENDPAEQVLEHMKDATGLRQTACPWQAFGDPFVQQVLRAHRWWAKGELATRYGRPIPEALKQGLDIFDAALSAVTNTDSRADREDREARLEELAKNPPGART